MMQLGERLENCIGFARFAKDVNIIFQLHLDAYGLLFYLITLINVKLETTCMKSK